MTHESTRRARIAYTRGADTIALTHLVGDSNIADQVKEAWLASYRRMLDRAGQNFRPPSERAERRAVVHVRFASGERDSISPATGTQHPGTLCLWSGSSGPATPVRCCRYPFGGAQ